MEAGVQSKIRIVQEIRIERDDGACRAAAEEIHFSPFSHEPRGCLPGLRLPDGLDDHVEVPAGLLADRRHEIAGCTHVNNTVRPQFSRLFQTRAATGQCDAATIVPGQHGEHKADGAAANDQHFLPRARSDFSPTLHHASQRLGQGRVGVAGRGRQPEHVFLHQARRHNDGFGISAIEKKKIVAKIFLAALTASTRAARSGIGHHDAFACFPARDPFGNFAY